MQLPVWTQNRPPRIPINHFTTGSYVKAKSHSKSKYERKRETSAQSPQCECMTNWVHVWQVDILWPSCLAYILMQIVSEIVVSSLRASEANKSKSYVFSVRKEWTADRKMIPIKCHRWLLFRVSALLTL